MTSSSPTQRAYTLRLKSAAQGDKSWAEKLWDTHEIVNKGARAFGDWLLTLRGGISHKLENLNDKETGEEGKKRRRILLALSWLSVESKDFAPEKYIVEKDGEDKHRTKEALEAILKSRNLEDEEVGSWVNDCKDSLTSSIRDDAVWVNRSRAFDDAVRKIGDSLTREEIWDVLGRFFGKKEAYLAPRTIDEKNGKTKKEEPKNLARKAGEWLSKRFGKGKGTDFSKLSKVYSEIVKWAEEPRKSEPRTLANLASALKEDSLQGILKLIKNSGSKSRAQKILEKIGEGEVSEENLVNLKAKAEEKRNYCKEKIEEKIEEKGEREWSNRILKSIEKSLDGKFTYLQEKGPARHWEFAVMLDHAARRISAGHTWIKLAEARRREFEENSQKIKGVPENARQWLETYREDRSKSSGAIEGYLISKRAVTEWETVVKAWKNCKTEEDRIAAAGALQDNPEIDQFGDINLFRALASEDARCVWQVDGKPDANILLNYVAATKAEFDKRRFKVPAYRHPDPLLHPVFCDYGNSRWKIRFDVHEANRTDKKAKQNKKTIETADVHGLKMDLWTGSKIENVSLRWQSKLLEKDLAVKQLDGKEDGKKEVSRASRLGRVAAGAGWETPVSASSVFAQKHWNGRLQASRKELSRIARRVKTRGWDEKANSMKKNLKWFITFSPKLKLQGPWISYVDNSEDKRPFTFTSKGEPILDEVFSIENKNRKGRARLILSRLPGLRVLSMDLGHRHAAACAVWETLSSRQLEDACAEGGYDKPAPDAMYHHIKSNRGKRVIYRRIGADELSDDSIHPTPWARLERQFLIKLQGEERKARMATADEIWEVHELERALGRKTPLVDRLTKSGWGSDSGTPRQRQLLGELNQWGWEPDEAQENSEDDEITSRESLLVDKLMSRTVDTVRKGLRRHGNRARIANFLVAREKTVPGGQMDTLNNEGRKEIIADALALWYELANGREWKDTEALDWWKIHIEPELSVEELPDIAGTGIAPKERKRKKKELKEKLKPVAERLLTSGAKNLSDQWCERWKQDDKEWQKTLRWLRDWILPRGVRGKSELIRNVGGLSLDRLTTIQSLYQAQKAYFTRITPKGIQMDKDKPLTAVMNFGGHILNDLENMREQRVKQLASRIVEAALGVGRVKIPKKSKDPKRHYERVDAPCHVVVIENLTKYRPEETRNRRENRQLMTWCSGKVKKYLSESCSLHGLSLWEVSPRYTSRQDSRTGSPGIRCEEVSVEKFFKTPFRQREVARAEEKDSKNKASAYEQYLIELKERWKSRSEETALLRIPRKGGEIFVSANSNSPASKGLQADLNAAANIGLKAITDPDWSGSWWYVPCSSKDFVPIKDKIGGSRAFENITTLMPNPDDAKEATGKKRSGKKEIINLWRNPACSPLERDEWERTAKYWNMVEYHVIKRLKRQMG